MPAVVIQYWVEHERGWGSRPDGQTGHLTSSDQNAFIKAYWDRMPDYVLDEYSAPSGSKILDVTDEAYEKIKNSKNGAWISDADIVGR